MTVTNGEGPPPGLSHGADDGRASAVPDLVHRLGDGGRSPGRMRLAYLTLGLSVLLSLVVLVQETRLSQLRQQSDRSARDAAAAERVYQ
ncbi:MAG TPA: hypothetical protein VHJ83_00770, partial [Micromonosporaceae bacterium]|nr:hypothetical protein [Micromonosporaceae bacterium]